MNMNLDERRYQHWTDEEINYLLENWWNKSKRIEISRNLNRSIQTITQKFYMVLKEKRLSPKEYYRIYSNKKSKEELMMADIPTPTPFELFSNTNSSKTRISLSEKTYTEQKQHSLLHIIKTTESVRSPENKPLTAINSEPLKPQMETKDSQTEELEISFEDIPRYLSEHHKRIRQMEAKLNATMTVREFATFFNNLEQAYAQIEQLQSIIDEQEKTISDLQQKLKLQQERVRMREEELRNALDAVDARLADFLEKRPHEKIQYFAQFQEDLRTTIDFARNVANKRFSAI